MIHTSFDLKMYLIIFVNMACDFTKACWGRNKHFHFFLNLKECFYKEKKNELKSNDFKI